MKRFFEVRESKSELEAHRLYIELCFKVIHTYCTTLDYDKQLMLDDAKRYWSRPNPSESLTRKLDLNYQILNNLLKSESISNSTRSFIELKVLLLVLNTQMNIDYYDYYLDWIDELASHLDITNKQMTQWIDTILSE